jgi:integrase
MARKYRYVNYNVATDADTIRLPSVKKYTRYFTVDELEKILRAAQPGDKELILVTVLTGLRWGEVTAALEPRDFNPEKEWVSSSGYKGKGGVKVTRQIPAHLHPDKLKDDDPKSEHGIRTVQLLWPVRMTLMDLDVKRRANEHKRYFRGPISDYLEYNTFNARWRKLLKNLGIGGGGRRARFHDLRHTFASLQIAWGETKLMWIAEALGHGGSRLVQDTYGHLIDGGAPLDREATLNRLWEACHSTTAPASAEVAPGTP